MEDNIPCRKMFSDTLLELAKNDVDIVVVTSDARGSVTLDKFASELPEQFVEVGIAEQNSIGIGAGLALCGKKPFVCGPACFLSTRSLEQIKLDASYTGANVKIIGVSGGVSYGALGSTHHSLQDIAFMRSIPNISIVLPCDIYETKKMTEALINYSVPVYVRMGRGPVPNVYSSFNIPFEIGKANILKNGSDITLIGTGETVHLVHNAGIMLKEYGINARVIDMHTIKPLDEEVILQAAKETGHIITVEEHSINGGLGSAVCQFVSENYPVPVKILGIPDEPAAAGTSSEIFRYYGLTAENICNQAVKMIK